MAKDLVKVRVLDLPGINIGCSCCEPSVCGTDYFLVSNKVKELNEALEKAFPGKTSTEYVDLLKSPEEKETEFGKLLASRQQPSPLVIIDGDLLFAGSIQTNIIVEDVGKRLNS